MIVHFFYQIALLHFQIKPLQCLTEHNLIDLRIEVGLFEAFEELFCLGEGHFLHVVLVLCIMSQFLLIDLHHYPLWNWKIPPHFTRLWCLGPFPHLLLWLYDPLKLHNSMFVLFVKLNHILYFLHQTLSFLKWIFSSHLGRHYAGFGISYGFSALFALLNSVLLILLQLYNGVSLVKSELFKLLFVDRLTYLFLFLFFFSLNFHHIFF